METAIITALITSLVALVIGLFNAYVNLRVNRKTSFINTVTNERIKWLDKLRENLSNFSAQVYELGQTSTGPELGLGTPEYEEKLIKIRRIQIMLKLQLNPNDIHDQTVTDLIDEIFDLIERSDLDEIPDKMDSLVSATQSMLKAEWEKVKHESLKGRIYVR